MGRGRRSVQIFGLSVSHPKPKLAYLYVGLIRRLSHRVRGEQTLRRELRGNVRRPRQTQKASVRSLYDSAVSAHARSLRDALSQELRHRYVVVIADAFVLYFYFYFANQIFDRVIGEGLTALARARSA